MSRPNCPLCSDSAPCYAHDTVDWGARYSTEDAPDDDVLELLEAIDDETGEFTTYVRPIIERLRARYGKVTP